MTKINLDVIISIIIFLTTLLVLKYGKKLIHKKLSKKNSNSKLSYLINPAIIILENFSIIFILGLSIFLGLNFLTFSKKITLLITKIFTVVLFYQLGLWIDHISQFFLKKRFLSENINEKNHIASSFWLLSFFIKVLTWFLLLLVLLDNLGGKRNRSYCRTWNWRYSTSISCSKYSKRPTLFIINHTR